jgi:hypothetical protein
MENNNMNKKIIFWIICWFTATLCQAQMQDNTVWTEYDINTQNSSINFKRQYWVANDTIINGRTYKKVVDNNRYIGAIREVNGKIYAYLNYGDYLLMNDEFLLYDFTVQAGDVIRSTALEGALSNPDGLTVIQIDEVTLENGEKRKRFFFDGTSAWIEGIGSTGGLFHDAIWLISNYTVPYLVCFKQNEIPLYVNTGRCLDRKCCDNVSPDTGLASLKKSNVLFPNPTKGIVTIDNIVQGSTVHLIDSTGKVLQTYSVINNEVKIDLLNYPSNIYYVNINSDKSVKSFKIIKQ